MQTKTKQQQPPSVGTTTTTKTMNGEHKQPVVVKQERAGSSSSTENSGSATADSGMEQRQQQPHMNGNANNNNNAHPPQQVYVTPNSNGDTKTTVPNGLDTQLENLRIQAAKATEEQLKVNVSTNSGGHQDSTTTTTTTSPHVNHSTGGSDFDDHHHHGGEININDHDVVIHVVPQDVNGDVDDEDNEEDDEEDDPMKLFIGQIPKSLNEEDIFPTFESFGPLKDVAVIRDKHTGLHRGCAFVTYWNAADAERAMDSLHDKFTFQGARKPAQVKPAVPSENKLFIGMLSRTAGEKEVREIFAPFGDIKEIYMIRNGDGSSKCAAFLRYVKRESAINAIDSLNNSNIYMDGSSRPLIVKFADNKIQKHQRQMRNMRRHELLSMGGPAAYHGGFPVPQGVPPPMAMGGHHGGGPQGYPMPPHAAAQYGAAGYVGGGQGGPPPGPNGHGPHGPPPPYGIYPPHVTTYGPANSPLGYVFGPVANSRQEMRGPNPRPREGPAGANLFVYHLPHDLTDADLATAFTNFGNVISAKVYVDKYTGESKGFGFISYDSVIAAESAIEQMNGFQIGNKRLKVQHKRVHGHNGMQQPPPAHVPQQQQLHQQPPPQQHTQQSSSYSNQQPSERQSGPSSTGAAHQHQPSTSPPPQVVPPTAAVPPAVQPGAGAPTIRVNP